MYDSPMDYYKNAEPRLRAYVIFPGDVFKGKEIEIYAGVWHTGPRLSNRFLVTIVWCCHYQVQSSECL